MDEKGIQLSGVIRIEPIKYTLCILFFSYLSCSPHNTDKAQYDFVFCNYAIQFTKQITYSRSTRFFIFPSLSHYVLSLSIRFQGLRSSTYISPVVTQCTSEVVYILNSY